MRFSRLCLAITLFVAVLTSSCSSDDDVTSPTTTLARTTATFDVPVTPTAPPRTQDTRSVDVPEAEAEILCGLAEELITYDFLDPEDQDDVLAVLEAAAALDVPDVQPHLQTLYDAAISSGFDEEKYNEQLATDPALAQALVVLESFVIDYCDMASLFGA